MKLLQLSLFLGTMPMLISPVQAAKTDSIACPAAAEIAYKQDANDKDKWLFSGTSGVYEFQGAIDVVNPDLDKTQRATLSANQIIGEGSFELTCSYTLKAENYDNPIVDLITTVNEYKICKVQSGKFKCTK